MEEENSWLVGVEYKTSVIVDLGLYDFSLFDRLPYDLMAEAI